MMMIGLAYTHGSADDVYDVEDGKTTTTTTTTTNKQNQGR